jgi:uncharacterized protein with HEPN domain
MEIDSFFADNQKHFNSFQKDIKTKRAIERNIEIIGEAMNRILKHNQNITISHSKKIVDVRNRIIHGYDSVSDDIIWGIVIKHLPILKNEIEIILNEIKVKRTQSHHPSPKHHLCRAAAVLF